MSLVVWTKEPKFFSWAFGEFDHRTLPTAFLFRLGAASYQFLRRNRRTDGPSSDSGIANQSLCVLCNATTTLSRCPRQYLTGPQSKHPRLLASHLQDPSWRSPSIEFPAVLFDVQHNWRRQQIATITWAIITALDTVRHLVFIVLSKGDHENKE